MPLRYFGLVVGLFLVTWQPPSSAAQASPETVCPESVLVAVGKHFGLSHFAYPQNNDGQLAAGVCRRWPTNRTQIISAFVYGHQNDGSQKLLLALVDPVRQKVLATHKRDIEEDATTEFNSDSLKLDLAKYQLTKDIRAFALRENSFRERCTYDGGIGEYLTLFVVEQSSIRPVFQITMSEWSYGPGDRCSGAEVSITETSNVISVEKTTSNGFADLKLSAKQDGRTPSSGGAIFQYNGCHYVGMPWTQWPCKK